MILTRDSVDCDNNFDWATTWLIPLMDKIVDYINALEAAQNQATDAVSSEVGTARSGFASLLAKIQAMDGVSADLLAMVQGIAAGIDPVVYDPAATYEKNARVVYDGGLYICIAADPVTGVAPPAESAWKNMLGWEKCPTPTLAGPLAADESTVQRISLGTSYDANARYWPTVSGGTLSELLQFPNDGSQYAGEWGWEWTLPTLSVDVPHQILLYATKDGYARSNDVIWNVTVRDVPVEEATVSWPDTVENYTEGIVAGGIITAPARTVGCDSASQVLAVSPAIVWVNGKMVILDGTTESVLKLATLVAAGDVIITDQGECVVLSVDSAATSHTYRDWKWLFESNHGGGDLCLSEIQLLFDGSDLIPQMTAETTSGWTITGTDCLTTNYPWRVADDNDGFVWATANDSFPKELILSAPGDVTADGYSLDPYSADRSPGSWKFYGRKDGDTEWTLIEEKTESSAWDTVKSYAMEVAYEYTATLAQALPGVPTKGFKKGAVQLKVAAGATGQAFTESDFTLTPADYTYTIDGDDLKISGAEIALEDNPDLKRIAMAITGPEGMTFNRALAYIKRFS